MPLPGVDLGVGLVSITSIENTSLTCRPYHIVPKPAHTVLAFVALRGPSLPLLDVQHRRARLHQPNHVLGIRVTYLSNRVSHWCWR